MVKKKAKKTTKKRVTKTIDVCDTKSKSCGSGCPGAFYGLGFLGALFYFLSMSTGFWSGIVGILKAAIWPLFLVLELLKFIGA